MNLPHLHDQICRKKSEAVKSTASNLIHVKRFGIFSTVSVIVNLTFIVVVDYQNIPLTSVSRPFI